MTHMRDYVFDERKPEDIEMRECYCNALIS